MSDDEVIFVKEKKQVIDLCDEVIDLCESEDDSKDFISITGLKFILTLIIIESENKTEQQKTDIVEQEKLQQDEDIVEEPITENIDEEFFTIEDDVLQYDYDEIQSQSSKKRRRKYFNSPSKKSSIL
jgi:hypothetical protein